MAKSWDNNIRHIVDGEAVNAGVAGRPDRTLEGNLRYLREVVDSALLGQALFLRDVTVASTVLVGQPVYWNSVNQQFEAALAAVENDAESNTLVPKASSDVVGVVHSKSNSTLADVASLGWLALDIDNAVDGTIAAGRYYLSSAEAGKLTTQRPPVSVPVLFADGQGNVMLTPALRDFVEDHVHYTFELTAKPAGTAAYIDSGNGTTVVGPPPNAEDHAISGPDAALEGWLPASHTSFDGKAPTGAEFGYNLATHSDLQKVWPPIPVSAAAITWDKGVSQSGGTNVKLGAAGGAIVDANGIWWMSKCYGDVPWFKDYNSASPPADPTTGQCPREEAIQVLLHYARMVFATDKSVVTSLQTPSTSVLTITNCDNDAATTGDLHIDADFNLLTEDEDLAGHQVIKEISDNKYKRGPVVEGLFAGSGEILLSSDSTKTVSGLTMYTGQVTVSRNIDSLDREMLPQIVRLDDVVERFYKDVTYIGFPQGRESSVRYRFNVPPSGLPSNPKFKLRVVILGRIGGSGVSLPAMNASYRIIPRPTAFTALPTTDTAFSSTDFNTVQGITTADTYIEVESTEVSIAAGDTILVKLSRPAGTGYNAEVGVIRIGAVITSG